MPAGGRTPFTPQDDTLLSKYLAKYNPGIQGRSGNKIYQLLVENEHDKWPWSSRHPWQGWRDRYTKNQSQFNKRIKEYQVKKGLPTENTHWINGTQKLKGSDAEEEEGGASGRETDEDGKAKGRVKRKRKSVPNADARKRAKRDESDDEDHSGNDSEEYVPPLRRPRTHVPDLYPDITVLDDPSSPSPPAPSAKPKPKPKLKPKTKPKPKPAPEEDDNADDDFFESVPSVPPTPTTTNLSVSGAPTASSSGHGHGRTSAVSGSNAKPKSRGLPQLVEGTFRTVFAGVQRAWAGATPSAGDGDGDGMDVEEAIVNERNAAPAKESEPEPEPEPRRPPPPRQVNAVASSSRVQLPAARAPSEVVVEEDELGAELDDDNKPDEEVDHEVEYNLDNDEDEQELVADEYGDEDLHSSSRLDDIDRQILALQRERQRREIRSSSPNMDGSSSPRRRSPSPLDWGSPGSSPTKPQQEVVYPPTPVPSKKRHVPPPLWPSPFPGDARGENVPVPATQNGHSPSHPHSHSQHNRDRHRSSMSVDLRSLRSLGTQDTNTDAGRVQTQAQLHPRRSLAPGPSPRRVAGDGADARYYSLASPPFAHGSRVPPGSGSGSSRSGAVPTPTPLPVGFKPFPNPIPITKRESEPEPRRHSFPRVDFQAQTLSYGLPSLGGGSSSSKGGHGKTTTTTTRKPPRQSLPPQRPRAGTSAPLPPRRHGSLFSPRRPPVLAPPAASAPARRVSSLSNRASSSSYHPDADEEVGSEEGGLLEQLGEQALALMAANHGFGREVVRNVFARAKDMRRADEVLRRMREEAERAGEEALGGVDGGQVAVGQEEDGEERGRGRGIEYVGYAGVGFEDEALEPERERVHEEEEEPLVLRHRRRPSGVSGSSPPSSRRTNDHSNSKTANDKSGGGSGKNKAKTKKEAETFHPQPLARPVLVLAETEYTPPMDSRAGAVARMKKREQRASLPTALALGTPAQGRVNGSGGSGGRGGSGHHATGGSGRSTNGRPRADNESPTRAPFAAYAAGNMELLREMERRNVELAMVRTADVARYMADGLVPSPGEYGGR